LGFAEANGFVKLARATDRVLKSVSLRVTKYEKIGGGFVAICFIGELASVSHGVEIATEMGLKTALIAAPGPVVLALLGLDRPQQLGNDVAGQEDLTDYPMDAVGLIETKGFIPMIVALDAMEKAAQVGFIGYDTLGEGLVMTAIHGDISSVKFSLEAGEEAASQMGELVSAELISRPQNSILQTLPGVETGLRRLLQ
jgi:microcompartment protein CcmL/EutN